MNSNEKIFVLSTPKSGTHLWKNILLELGFGDCDFQTGYYNIRKKVDDHSAFFEDPNKYNLEQSVLESLKNIKAGEFGYGHLPCTPEITSFLLKNNFKVIFTHRNLRDSICSMMRYASKFKYAQEEFWANSKEHSQARLIQFMHDKGPNFEFLVNPMLGWLNLKDTDDFLIASYDEIKETNFSKRVAQFLKIELSAFSIALENARKSPSLTKSSAPTNYQSYWNTKTEDLFEHLGLDYLNTYLGYARNDLNSGYFSSERNVTADKQRAAKTKQPLHILSIGVAVNVKSSNRNYMINFFKSLMGLEDCEIVFFPLTMQGRVCESFDFSALDAIIMTPHIRPWLTGWGNVGFEAALARYQGDKIIFLHDEYDETNKIRQWILDFNINHVFTVVPEPFIDKVYPSENFLGVNFSPSLTGYVYEKNNNRVDIKDRGIDIFYRGRPANLWMGELVAEKFVIGEAVSEWAKQNQLIVDISSARSDRLANSAFMTRLANSKITLATESGSNVFDEDGQLRRWFKDNHDDYLAGNITVPDELNFKEENIGVKMNQISPKMFEAITQGTVLMMYEGEYSGILIPDTHYIVLKKDHSNFDQILEIMKQDDELQAIADRAYQDIVESEKYSHEVLQNQLQARLPTLPSKPKATTTLRFNGLCFEKLLAHMTDLTNSMNLLQRSEIISLKNTRDRHKQRISTLAFARDKLVERNEKLKARTINLTERVDALNENNNKLLERVENTAELNKKLLNRIERLKENSNEKS